MVQSSGGLRPQVPGGQPTLRGGHTAGVTSVAWAPDGNRIASASDDNTVRLWNAHDGALLETHGFNEIRVLRDGYQRSLEIQAYERKGQGFEADGKAVTISVPSSVEVRR